MTSPMNSTPPITPTPPARPATGMPMWAQRALAGLGVLALLFLLFSIGKQIAATQMPSRAADIALIQAGPYGLSVYLATYPADAGYTMPFIVAPTAAVDGQMTYTVSAVPLQGVDATPVNAAVTPDPHIPNRINGTVEITVQGQWQLRIIVNGPQGPGVGNAPIFAKAPAALPTWIAWPIGLIPAIGLALFFLYQRRSAGKQTPSEPTA